MVLFAKKKNAHAGVYVITNLEGLVFVINIINGLLRVKSVKLGKLIDFLNIYSNANLSPALPNDTSDIKSNAWFCGFSDSDSSFQIRAGLTKSGGGTYRRVTTTYELSQALISIHGDNRSIMALIASALGMPVENKTRGGRLKLLRVRSSNMASCKAVVNYFDTYPLWSSKRNDCDSFIVIHRMMLKGEHLSIEGFNKIKLIKAGMNKGRTSYNWDHLK